ncbi:MAG: DUF6088 family protein [Sulfuricaulis sp.]
MLNLRQKILELIAGLPEGATLGAKELLHLGSRAALDQALSRLVRRGLLMRAGRGLYVRPIETRFGVRAPSAEKVVEAIASLRGETVVSHGATAANALGLTTQVPVRVVYLTSGRNRHLKLGAQTVELKHAPSWQLIKAGEPAGEAVRALAWLGPAHAREALKTLKQKLPESEVRALSATRNVLPGWLAEQVSTELAVNG